MARIGKSRLTHKHISFLLYQILCAVKYLHESNIMHRDLKPDNIGVNDQGCEVKLLDFGLSCVQAHDLKHSPYVVTRFYRAPEIVLGLEYSKKVDLWSVGCILAEMISKKIMFPGEHYFLQWQTIVHVLGKPGRNFLQKMDERTREYALSPGPQGGQSWEEMFPAEKYSLPEDEAPIDRDCGSSLTCPLLYLRV
uniref:Protein kinase domain-containing protein n=1 Tax=Steinernema glaseri TaxID=37863 RepID=A0A1I8AHD4_9BILA